MSSTKSSDLLQQFPIMQKYIEVMQGINIAITILFLLAYLYRLFHLRHFAITEQFKRKHPCVRIVLCISYVIISIPFLALSIINGINDKSQGEQQQFWVIEIGVGEFVDSIILIMQLIVLHQELNKQRPYTPFHLLFNIYLTFISILRLIFAFVNFRTQSAPVYQSIAFYLAFLINSVLLLGYWIAKRQQLPEFENHDYFNFDQLHNLNSTRNIMHRNIEISQFRKTSENFNYIHPTVSVEKNQFRIILQVSTSDDELQLQLQQKQSVAEPDIKQNRSTRKISRRKSKLISSNLYSMNQILELYKICGRFNIKQKLKFDENNLAVFYKNLQNYLDELFSNRKNYLRFMLNFFDIPEQYTEFFERALRETFKDSELDIYANMDKNASILSINIFKQLWMDEYYLFYMDVVAVDGKFESRPMRRFNDFQMFHAQLTNIIKKRYAGKYVLPSLPKKYLFNWDQSKITQRRTELQTYLRSLTNDYKFMLECHEVRQATLQFLGYFDVVALVPIYEIFQNFYKNIQVFKGSISKQLSNGQYITYYQFKILCNGLPIRSLKKRFNDFVILHQSIQRWMTNTQINYRFLVLPEKHLYKSGTDRHDKLRAYLQALIKVQEIWKVYEVNDFFKVGNNSFKDISMSRIQSPDEQKFQKMKTLGLNMSDEIQTPQRFIDEDSFQSKGRMSALIEELGNN